jgi:hypothetical protein
LNTFQTEEEEMELNRLAKEEYEIMVIEPHTTLPRLNAMPGPYHKLTRAGVKKLRGVTVELEFLPRTG